MIKSIYRENKNNKKSQKINANTMVNDKWNLFTINSPKYLQDAIMLVA